MQDFHKKLISAWTDYVSGTMDAKTLKGHSAGFGIYQQRDDKTMMRIRRIGGHLTLGDLQNVANILRSNEGDFAHLTTRQDVQLHGIPAARVTATLEVCENVGFNFRGGGGDTFRNTLVSSYSGLHNDSAFDVVPYAKALSDAFYRFDLAYALPRKLKIGFADRPADAAIAQSNDLGFLAKIVDGKHVFETYLGGGIGFKPQLGIKLFDALPAEDCIRVAMALTALFNDKGCRTNRAHARIRFLREDLGDDGLVKLFHEYLAKIPEDAPKANHYESSPINLPGFPNDAIPAEGFENWKSLAVTPLASDLAAVRLFVPFGNFTADELDAFVQAMKPFGTVRFEVLSSLDLGLVVPSNQLAGVYNILVTLEKDLTAKSFVGNIRTCIGCRVCKSGITDAPEIGRTVAEYFDAKYRPLDTDERVAVARALLNDVRISGCPNSCTNHPLAKFGFAGRKLNGADAETVFTPGSMNPPKLGAADAAVAPVAADDLPAFLEAQILKSINTQG